VALFDHRVGKLLALQRHIEAIDWKIVNTPRVGHVLGKVGI
jgi:hypothetical protein